MWRTVEEFDIPSCFRKALESNHYRERRVRCLTFRREVITDSPKPELLEPKKERPQCDVSDMPTILEVTNDHGSITLYDVDM